MGHGLSLALFLIAPSVAVRWLILAMVASFFVCVAFCEAHNMILFYSSSDVTVTTAPGSSCYFSSDVPVTPTLGSSLRFP
jgi:hypothetical protein